ncbi:MAG: DUF2062 domain-containing protein [Hyphomicrobiales bacterium]
MRRVSIKKFVNKMISIKDKPNRIIKGFAMGSFVGMLPFPGFQMLIALFFASIFKLNKKASCIAVFNTNVFTGLFIFAFNYWLGKIILGVDPDFVFPDRLGFDFVVNIMEAGSDVFFSLLVGGVITGIGAYIFSFYLIRYIFTLKTKSSYHEE